RCGELRMAKALFGRGEGVDEAMLLGKGSDLGEGLFRFAARAGAPLEELDDTRAGREARGDREACADEEHDGLAAIGAMEIGERRAGDGVVSACAGHLRPLHHGDISGDRGGKCKPEARQEAANAVGKDHRPPASMVITIWITNPPTAAPGGTL